MQSHRSSVDIGTCLFQTTSVTHAELEHKMVIHLFQENAVYQMSEPKANVGNGLVLTGPLSHHSVEA